MAHPIMTQLRGELELLTEQLTTYKQTLQKSLANRSTNDGLSSEAMEIQATRLTDRIAQIEFLESVPAFQRITLTWTDDESETVLWIAKFGYLPLDIYSWATPIGKLRFYSTGNFSIETPGGTKTGTIHSKLIFQIVNSKMIFLSSQTESGTELVHQEHFANHEFALKEVVSRLESYQDDIISTDFQTPLQITGPAGSGKTTLGFHRLAYLHQNSSVSNVFDTTSSLALINDESTRDYFMSVLKPLNMGHQVRVVTPTEWMSSLLQIPKDITIANDYATNDIQMLWYYWAKSRIELPERELANKEYISYLTEAYARLPHELQEIWQTQAKKKRLDRYDLAVLMRAHTVQHRHVLYQKPVNVLTKKFGNVIQYFPEVLRYASILTDEFQNYTSYEHQLIQSCIHPETNALSFVGDPNQKTLPGAQIRVPTETKHIHIDKTYRNSAAILDYLADKGYNVPSSSGSVQAGAVYEHSVSNKESLDHIMKTAQETRATYAGESIGIIVFEEELAKKLQATIATELNIFVGTSYGVQGVEFEHAIVVLSSQHSMITTPTPNPSLREGGGHNPLVNIAHPFPPEFLTEYHTIMRDRIYVALTRAISTLTVISTTER